MRGFFQVKPVVVTSGAHADDPSMVETMQEESDLSPPDLGGCVAVTLSYESDLADDEPIDMLSEDEGILEDAGKGSNERHKKRRRTLEVSAREQRRLACDIRRKELKKALDTIKKCIRSCKTT